MFEDSKGQLGMDHFEVRRYRAIQRHLVLSAVSHLFLAEFQERERGKKSGPDADPTPRGRGGPGADLDLWRTLFAEAGPSPQPPGPYHPTTQRPRGPVPPTPNPTPIAPKRRVFEGHDHLSNETFVA